MSISSKTYEMKIAGVPFRIRSAHDFETVRELVDFVDLKVRTAMQATRYGSLQSAAILTALNLAEDLMLIKKRALKDISQLETRAQRISQDLEQIIES